MSVWRNLLATLFPWFFKGALDAAATAATKGDVGASIKENINAATQDPNVIAAENAIIDETIKKVTKTKKP